MEKWAYLCKKFQDDEETEARQMVRRPETVAAEGGENPEEGAANDAGGAVQDAVHGAARVRPADGRGALQPHRVAAGAVGGVDDGRAVGVAGRGVAGDGAALLRGAGAGLRGPRRAGVLPDGDERRGFPPDVPDADGGRPDAVHAADAGGGSEKERHRVAAEPQPVVPPRVRPHARRAPPPAAAEGRHGALPIITRTPRQ